MRGGHDIDAGPRVQIGRATFSTCALALGSVRSISLSFAQVLIFLGLANDVLGGIDPPKPA
jgi:hypothetical protein